MKNILIVMIAGLSLSLHASEDALPYLPKALDLGVARQLVMAHNPSLKISLEKIKQQEGDLKQVQALRLPRLDLGGNYAMMDDGLVQQFGDGPSSDETRWDMGAEASLNVFAGGRSREMIRASRKTYEAFEEEAKVTQQRVLFDMYRAYYAAQLANERILDQQEAVEVLQQQRDEAENRFNAGVGTKYELMQAKVAFANAKPPVIRAKNAYRAAVDHLRQTIGLPYPAGTDPADISLAAPEQPILRDISLENALDVALEMRPEFHRMDAEYAASEHEVEAVRREHRPLVGVYGGYGFMNDQFGGEDLLEGWTVGLRLNWNFMDGGAHRGRLMQSLAVRREVEHRHGELSLSVEGDIRQAHYERQEATAIFATASGVIESAEEALRLSQNRYKAGKGTQLDVLSSQLQLTHARLELAVARHDLNVALIRMKHALGEAL